MDYVYSIKCGKFRQCVASRIGGGGLYGLSDPVIDPEMKLNEMKGGVDEGWHPQCFCHEDKEPERSRSSGEIAVPDPNQGEQGELPPCSENEYRVYFNTELRLLHEYRYIHHDEKETYFYHPDHLGSSSWITDQNGDAIQHLQYLPFGEQYVDQRTTGWNAMFTFSGKERDEETGYSYFGARYYDSDISIWLSVDPLAHKYPMLSPYAYCANNPIRLMDPDGRDIWDINENGQVVGHTKDKTQDAFYMVAKDADGNYQRTFTTDAEGNKTYNSISFEYGTVESQRTTELNSTDSYDTYKVRGDANGTQMFEFMSQNTTVEWSQAKTGIAGDKGLNFLTTSHDKSTERGMSNLINGQLRFGYTAREFNHNHPSNTAYPSGIHGLTGDSGDVPWAGQVSNIFGNQVKFNIYTPNTHKYHSFGPYSKRSDYLK